MATESTVYEYQDSEAIKLPCGIPRTRYPEGGRKPRVARWKFIDEAPASQAGGKKATKTRLAKYFWVVIHVRETRLHSKFLIFVDIFRFKMLVTVVSHWSLICKEFLSSHSSYRLF